MSDLNAIHNRVVWFDLPVVELDRAIDFYQNVLAIEVSKEKYETFEFAVLEHDEGNGGCLVPGKKPGDVSDGILIYLNVNHRLQDAVTQVDKFGGKIIEPIHPIGPHGFRAIVHDSEGNRIVLHSESN